MAETSTAVIASANNLSVKYGSQVVLDGATIAFTEGDHLGLVGRNGSGKSTLLQIAAGVARADSGEFTRRRDLVTGYMPQVSGLDDAATVHANILSGAQRILDLVTEYERVPGDSPLSATLLDQIIQADGWNLEHRIKSLITNLHAPESDRVVGTLSGGEKRRVALCRALLARPDFLILDEPTNHLDTGSIEWLEDFLARYTGTCLFVTHDRYFLDRVATRIVELSRGQFTSYDGNYTDYLLARVPRSITSIKIGSSSTMKKQFGKKSGAAEKTSRSASRASPCALICGDFFSAKSASTRRFRSSAAANAAGCCSLKS